jgi:hypothetical protein
MLLNAPGRSATVLVAFAFRGDRPAATSAGKVSSVPPPAIALTNPARRAAPAPMASWVGETGAGGMAMGRWCRRSSGDPGRRMGVWCVEH